MEAALNDFSRFADNAIAWALSNKERDDYQLKCLAFVEDAYEYSNRIEMFGGDTAAESADIYAPLRSGPPLRGSFAFYDAEGEISGIRKNWGHVGLAIEDGRLIHTWDRIRIDDHLSVEMLIPGLGWSRPVYRGWVPPEVFLRGFVVKS